MNTRKVRAPPCRPAAHNKCGLGPASRSYPFFGELCCPRLAISRSLWKGNGDPAAKEYMNDRHKIILFVFVVR